MKGVDVVIRLAERYSHCSFTVVGVSAEVTARLGPLPSNLVLLPRMPQESFMRLLAESQFVLQLSIIGGFPECNSVRQCLSLHPIGSSVGPIPHIIGDTGYLMKSPDPVYLSEDLMRYWQLMRLRVLKWGKGQGTVATLFHISERENAFLEVLGDA